MKHFNETIPLRPGDGNRFQLCGLLTLLSLCLSCGGPSAGLPDGTNASAAPDTAAESPAPSREEILAESLRPFYRNGWLGWEKGTTVVMRYLDSPEEGMTTYVQPDIVYRVGGPDNPLSSLQEVNGRLVEQRLFPGNPEEGLFTEASIPGSAPGRPDRLVVGNEAVALMLYEFNAQMDVIGADPGSSGSIAIQMRHWVLPAFQQIWIRREDDGESQGYQLIRSAAEPCTVGEKQHSCIVFEKMTVTGDGHILETRHLSADVPGYVVEEIVDIHTGTPKVRIHRKVQEVIHPSGTARRQAVL